MSFLWSFLKNELKAMETEVLVYYPEQNKIRALQQFKGQKFGLRNNNRKFVSVPSHIKVSFWYTIWKLPPSYICSVERPVRCEVLVPGQCHYFCLGNIPALTIVYHSFYSQHTVCLFRFQLLTSVLLYSALNRIGKLYRLFEAKNTLS